LFLATLGPLPNDWAPLDMIPDGAISVDGSALR